ncbi:MAG: ankyrin repeat domain-containing protein [Simkaniaceae bacterium]|nr:ankyrin repeat domain-containing protein [Simkaniaceae bacterium]
MVRRDSPPPTDTPSASRIQTFSFGYFGRYALAGFVSGMVTGATIGKVVTLLPGTQVKATIGKVIALLPGTPVGATAEKIVAYLSATPLGTTIEKAVTHLPGTWMGAVVGATCGTVVGIVLSIALGCRAGQRGRESCTQHEPGERNATDPDATDEDNPTELMRAVIATDFGGVETLVKDGSVDLTSVNAKDGMTAFLYACRDGSEAIARLLYEAKKPSKADVQRALVLVAEKGYENMITWLITSCKANASLPDDSGKTALMSASGGGHCDVIRWLIGKGVPVDRANRKDKNATALAYACANGHTDAAQLLLAACTAQKHRPKMGGAFTRAARNGHVEAMQWLIGCCEGADLLQAYGEEALVAASIGGSTEVVEWLLQRKVPVEDDTRAFFHACQNGHIEVAKLLYRCNPRLVETAESARGDTALILAAQAGHGEILRWLITTCGVDMLRGNDKGLSALMYVAIHGYTSIAEELLSLAENPILAINQRDEYGYTSFSCAAFNGRTEIVRLFLRTDPTLAGLRQQTRKGFTALDLASQEGYTDVVKLLLDAGSPVNEVDISFQGQTALCTAVCLGHVETARLLIHRGARVGPSQRRGETQVPMHMAARYGHTEAVELLHAYGAGIERAVLDRAVASKNKHTVKRVKELLAAGPVDGTRAEELREAGRCGNVEAVEETLSHNEGVDVDAADPDTGKTTLILAAENGHTKVVQRLLDSSPGVDVTRSDAEGHTALMLATKGGYKEIVKLLVDADIDTLLRRSYTGWTALMYAILRGDREITELLLSKIRSMQSASRGSSRTDFSGVTPVMMEIGSRIGMSKDDMNEMLMYAVKEGCADAVRLLIEMGAEVDYRDGEENTPAILAALRGYDAIIRLLSDAHADLTLHNRSGQTASDAARTLGPEHDYTAKLIDKLLSPVNPEKPSRTSSLLGALRRTFTHKQ